ncbi:hypothetical protein [Aquirhabdus parva]|uniref:Uncharacterized protein n=1 Tax=Aquirhabdus parva TaxID=2283318 RepID=A0A345P866_9GAMM|nr:hypothetical protein [Aquirhabdus parva]AXI03475.1 hypothetical protein HYN46_11865 [Aquirhabdus parva]
MRSLHILLFGLGFLGLIAIGGSLGFWLYRSLFIELQLKNQPASIVLPKQLNADANITNIVKIRLDGQLHAEVPIHQDFTIPLHYDAQSNIEMKADVPVRFTLKVNQTIPIHSYTDIEATTDLIYQSRFLPTLPIKIRLPLEFNLPIALNVPVDSHVMFDYNGPMKLQFNQTTHANIHETLHSLIPIHRDIAAPMYSELKLQIFPPTTPLPIVIRDSTLHFPAQALTLE